MDSLSARINSLPVSATLAMAAKARELKNQGVDVIGLSLGEPDFNTPEFIKEAAIQAVKDNWNSYSPVDGYADLKTAICAKFKRDNGLEYTPSQIVVSTGAKQSIANVCMVLLDPGDEVLLPAPYWVSYSAIATLAEAKYIEIPSSIETDFKITPAQLEAAITPKTKAIMLAHALGNPFNVGRVKEICDKHNLWLIEDTCDALGAEFNGQKCGTFGDIGTLSFYPAHHMTMGEGGAVFMNNPELKAIAESFRDWGRDCWCPPGKDNTCGERYCQKLGDLPDGYDHKYTY